MGCSESSPKREVYGNTVLPQETIKTLNRQPNFTPKTTGKRRIKKKNKTNISRRNHEDPSRNKRKRKEKKNSKIRLKAGSLRG